MHSCVNRNGFSFSERVTTQSHARVGIKFLYLKNPPFFRLHKASLLPERRKKDRVFNWYHHFAQLCSWATSSPIQSRYCGQTWATRDTYQSRLSANQWAVAAIGIGGQQLPFANFWRPMSAMELDKARKDNGPDIIFTIP